MNQKVLRLCILLSAAALAACTAQKPRPVLKPAGTTVQPVNTYRTPQPAGQRAAAGTTVRPTGSSASYTAVDYAALPQWSHQHFAKSLESFLKGCEKLQNQPGWQAVCTQAAQTQRNNHAARSFFEQYFTPWQVSENGQLGGTVTGYYEPVLHGDTQASARARFPVYGIPYDFVSVDLPANLRGSKATVRIRQTGQNTGRIAADGTHTANLAAFPITERTKALKGRFVGGSFVPYHTRNEINGGALNGKAPILGYANDPVELFFLQIQGSGRGYLPLAQTTMQGIKAYMQQNPQKLAEVLGQNPSYVFFRTLDDNSDGPIGALGTPLMGEYAGAVDRHHITLGAPLFVATTHPETRHGLNRLIMAQDTGSAIKGAVRVDYFWGYGDEAGRVAGKMKHTGYVWQLLPNGVSPQYRP